MLYIVKMLQYGLCVAFSCEIATVFIRCTHGVSLPCALCSQDRLQSHNYNDQNRKCLLQVPIEAKRINVRCKSTLWQEIHMYMFHTQHTISRHRWIYLGGEISCRSSAQQLGHNAVIGQQLHFTVAWLLLGTVTFTSDKFNIQFLKSKSPVDCFLNKEMYWSLHGHK